MIASSIAFPKPGMGAFPPVEVRDPEVAKLFEMLLAMISECLRASATNCCPGVISPGVCPIELVGVCIPLAGSSIRAIVSGEIRYSRLRYLFKSRWLVGVIPTDARNASVFSVVLVPVS